MGSELSTPTVVVGGTVAAGLVGAALYAKQHPDTPQAAPQAVAVEKDKGKGKAAAGAGRKRKGGSSLAGSTKRVGETSEKHDTPPALAAQAALFDASAEKGHSSAMEDVMASTTSVASKSSRRKRGRKGKAPPTTEQKEVEVEEEEEEEEEDEATPEPTMAGSSSAFGGSSKDKRTYNKFTSLLAESQHVSAKPSMDASWLQVDKTRAASAKRRKQQQQKASAEVSSDAGLTASATGDDSHSERGRGESNSMQALAGKIGHLKPKTQVDDMLPPEPTISRVMRVESAPDDDLLHSTDADADEEGWGIVRRRRASPNPASTPTAEPALSGDELTKDQRRREARKDATKAAKADAEADRLKKLAQHKKEQEKAKIEAMRKKELSAPKKGKESKLGGGMKLVVQDGKTVFE
ncbi:hypothetical protein FS837_011363 [Tulasnella sp. UAMH 9824]|nr:hypothetical protein FS837_011363 [Tulasnella sp. UAMH 9824]